jgi:putative endonuclease
MTNKSNTVIYVGITNNLKRRIFEHKSKLIDGFTKKYNLTKLVYYEVFNNPYDAISREKQIKSGSRKNKEKLIKSINPKLEDLYYKI